MTDLFKEDGSQPNLDNTVDPFEVLTGPGGKFDRSKYESDEDLKKALAKSVYHGDAYIDHMKQRQDELRTDYLRLQEEYKAGPKLAEILEQRFGTQNQQQTSTNPSEPESPVFDQAKLDEMINERIRQNKQLEREEENARTVEAKLIEHFGPNYQSSLKQTIDSMGLDKDFVNGLARKHPEVLFKTLGITGQRQQEGFQAPPASSRTASPLGTEPKRTNAYYQKLRKENPTLYRSPKIQDQMFKDALALGSAFEDGDWRAYGH